MLLSGALWVAASAPLRASAQDRRALAEARAAFDGAREAYARGDFDVALAGFQRAYEITRSPEILYNIATVADRLRRDDLALRSYEQYLEALPDAPDRDNVRARIAALRAAGVRREVVSVEDPPRDRDEIETSAAGGTRATPAARRDDEEPGGGGRVWTWVAAGTAVLAGGATAVLWSQAQSIHDDLARRCETERCDSSDVDASGGPTLQWIGNVTFGLGVVSLVAAAVLFFVEAGGDEEDDRATVEVGLAPDGVALRGRF